MKTWFVFWLLVFVRSVQVNLMSSEVMETELCVCVLPGVQVDVEAVHAQSAQPIRKVPHSTPEVICQSQREGEGEAAV